MSVKNTDLPHFIKDLKKSEDGDEIIEKALDTVANKVFNYQVNHAPVKSGKLRDGISIEKSPGYRHIGPNYNLTPYATFVSEGTEPHVIEPKKPDGVLAFKVHGRMVFTKKVNHPGTKPNPYIEDSAKGFERDLENELQVLVVNRVNGK